MSYKTPEELFCPRVDLDGKPTEDVFYHTLMSPSGPRTVCGFMGDERWQGHWFYQLGYWTKGVGIELGSFMGLSTVLFGMGMRDSPFQKGRIICVDWFKDGYLGVKNMLQGFKDNISAFGIEKYVTHYQGSCEEPDLVPPVEAEWLYLDASHYRAELRINMEIYGKMVKPGGLYIWHDTHMEEVLLHIEEVRKEQGITPVVTNRPDFQVWMKP